MDEFAPILMISYNRPDILRETLVNVSQCYDVEKHPIFMYIDGPRTAADAPQVEANAEVVEAFKRTVLPQIEIRRRECNWGGVPNARAAITDMLESYGRVIVIEDDILVSRTFLQYVENGLRFYKNEKRIWGINGYLSPRMKIPVSYPYDYFLSPRNSVWGWGTWRDRWAAVDFDLAGWDQFKKDSQNLTKVRECGADMLPMLEAQASGRLNAWDVQITYYMIQHDMYSVRPCRSLTKNNGFGTICEHCSAYNADYAKQKYYNLLPSFSSEVKPVAKLIETFSHLSDSPTILVRAMRKGLRLLHRYCGSSHREPFTI